MSRLFQEAMAENRSRYERQRRFRLFKMLPWPAKAAVYLALAAAGATLGFLAVVVMAVLAN